MIQQDFKVLMIGNGVLGLSLAAQYEQQGREVVRHADLPEDVSGYSEFVVLTSSDGINDTEALVLLRHLAERLPKGCCRPIVHLLLQSTTALWLLQTTDLPPEVNEKLEVYPFNMEDVWAKNLLIGNYPPLDRKPINTESEQTVHLLICGFDAQAKVIAEHAALVAHYPNYARNERLRTRITIIDRNLKDRRDAFMARRQHLFDNSYYRLVDVSSQTISLHRPMYRGRRKDFVDVEWEFVEATVTDAIVREHIASWATNERQQLSIVVSYTDDEKNIAEGMSLPKEVYDCGISVFVRQSSGMAAEALKRSSRFASVLPFGMKDCGYDVTQPLWQLAKRLNYFYACSYGGKGVPTVLPAEDVEAEWANVYSLKMRLSSLYNVMTMSTKMRSLGHNPTDASTFYALTQNEIKQLSATEHNRWSVERLMTGSRPCTDGERAEIRQDISKKKWYKKTKDVHFDLCAYEELELDETGKDVRAYDYDLIACIPLIIKSYYDIS